jgi:hypothetical protein
VPSTISRPITARIPNHAADELVTHSRHSWANSQLTDRRDGREHGTHRTPRPDELARAYLMRTAVHCGGRCHEARAIRARERRQETNADT